MIRAKIIVAALVAVAAVGMSGCPNGGFPDPATHSSTPAPATPAISTLSANSVVAGSPTMTITVTGSNFQSGTVVSLNGTALSTTFVSSTQVTATIPASALATAGTDQMTVSNSGGTASNAVAFTITNPAPTLTSLGPNNVIAGSAAFTMTVTGTGFVNGSTVSFGGSSLATTFVSSTQLTVTVPANLVASAGTAGVTVITAGPGGGTSGSQTFTINNPAPTITTINPNNTTAGSGAFTMTVTGTGFVSTSSVHFGGTSLTTTFVSATQLTATVPANLISASGTVSVTVVNSTPGGGTSNAVNFTVNSIGSDPCGGTGTATLSSISISPIGPGVGVGHHVTLTAIGKFSDGTTQPVTCPVTWTTASGSIATIDSLGSLTGVAAGTTQVTASVESGFFVSKTVADVCGSRCDEGIFTDYQFLIESSDNRGPQFMVGHIHRSALVSGKGTITGVEDVNTSASVKMNVGLTGTIQLFDDGRGDLQLIPDASSGLPTVAYRFAMFNDDAQGRIIEFDGKGTAKGELSQGSGSTALAANTNYAFGISGSSPSGGGNAMGEAGVFGTNASAMIACTAATCGIDANDNGLITAAAQLTASNFTAPDANGRGTVTLSYTNSASVTITHNFVYYVHGDGQTISHRLFLVETDAGTMALGGEAEGGNGFSSVNLCNFDNATTFLLQTPPVGLPNEASIRGDFDSVTHLVNDNSCGGTFINGESDTSSQNIFTGITATYTLGGTLGRGTVTETSAPHRSFAFYLARGSDAFLLDTSNAGAAVGRSVATNGGTNSIFIDPLTSTGSPWVILASGLGNTYLEQMYLLTGDGAGNVSGIGDESQPNGAPQFSFAVTAAYDPPPNPDAFGRAQFSFGSLTFVIYGIDTTRGYAVLTLLGGTIDSQP